MNIEGKAHLNYLNLLPSHFEIIYKVTVKFKNTV